LKDQANIESFDADKISISLGFLTIVTKEMEAEEQLKRTQNALRKSKKKFREQSIHDNLTGLYNTRYLYSALSKLITKSASSGLIFSLIFLDIDNFKYVVDTHGHLNASQVLQEIASTIKNTLNDPAYGVAYGGDEFVLVLPKFDKSRAVEMADALRTKIKETAYLQKAGLTVHVGASFGISTYPDDAQTLSELLALADQAMFSVKERGKDSVCSISYADAKEDGTVDRIFSYDCHT
jgi:diguanylate cyclase (GGDEF)-like protein